MPLLFLHTKCNEPACTPICLCCGNIYIQDAFSFLVPLSSRQARFAAEAHVAIPSNRAEHKEHCAGNTFLLLDALLIFVDFSMKLAQTTLS
jgi:hypothetical protein